MLNKCYRNFHINKAYLNNNYLLNFILKEEIYYKLILSYLNSYPINSALI